MITQRTRFWLSSPVMWILSGLGTAVCWADVQVNTDTTGNQVRSSVSLDAEGDFVVTWNSSSSGDAFANNIRGQRYRFDGFPLGGEFQVNTHTLGNQYAPSVALDADGDFVVTWNSWESGNPFINDIQGQRFASDGSPVGDEFQVNTYTTDNQFLPSVALDADGDFVVTWVSEGSGGTDTSFASIQGQLYASDGSPVGSDFQVNTYTLDNQFYPSVSMDADGDFVVAWISGASGGTDTSLGSIQAQLFASDGSPVGGQFQVNTYTTGYQYSPSVSLDAEGDFVIVWDRATTTISPVTIQGQRYASDGSPVGGQFQINTQNTYQSGATVSLDADGDFVVVWNSFGSVGTDTSSGSIQGQRFASDGSPVGSQFQVNTYTTGSQAVSSVSIAADGSDFVAVWQSDSSNETDSDGLSIQRTKLFAEIFADKFETGDTSRWSAISIPENR